VEALSVRRVIAGSRQVSGELGIVGDFGARP
jgi:hypothetical protein